MEGLRIDTFGQLSHRLPKQLFAELGRIRDPLGGFESTRNYAYTTPHYSIALLPCSKVFHDLL